MANQTGSATSGAVSGAEAGTAVSPGWGTVIGGAIGLGAGLLGGNSGDAGEAHNQMLIGQQILDEIQNAPDISKPLILEQYRQQGILTPAMEQQINVGLSQASQAKGSQQAQQAQLQALQQIQQRSQGGLTAADRASLNQILQQTGASTQGQRGAISQQMKAMGQGGSGADLAAELSAAQGGANTASQQGDALGAMAAQNALQAASMTGQLGGQIQGQQFGEQLQTGQAADAFRQFDVQNQMAQQQRNVGAQNQAQQYNLNTAQNVANANTTSQNQELNNQLQRQMQEYGANVNTAQIKAGAHFGQMQPLNAAGQAEGQAKANVGTGVGGIAQNLFGALSSSGNSSTPTTSSWQGGEIHDYKEGGKVSGIAKYAGDHPGNDTVHAMLSPGEIVIPRSMAKSSIGKRLAKLLEDHHQLRKDIGE